MKTVTIEFSRNGTRYDYLFNDGDVKVGDKVSVWSEFSGDTEVTVVAVQEGRSFKASQKARRLPAPTEEKWEVVCDVKDGCIEPTFRLDSNSASIHTSGFLKYFFPLEGKKVKITIEVVE